MLAGKGTGGFQVSFIQLGQRAILPYDITKSSVNITANVVHLVPDQILIVISIITEVI